MANKAAAAMSPRLSDASVKAKTGKTWNEWFAILDRAGAEKMGHSEIAGYLSTKQGVGPWWQQMVAVTYEQARGLRKLHQRPDGYQISVSRTIAAPLEKLYKSVTNKKTRDAWLAEDGLEVRKATANKSMRSTWNEGKTNVEFNFYGKGDQKSQVVVQHSKLPNEKASAKMKAYWRAALDRLSALVEK
jgi:uncharacterized protein YndB with AHSA1/START domain